MARRPSSRLRTETLIAGGRLLLAAFTLLAIWIDPSEPSKHVGLTYALLAAYVAYAVGQMLLVNSRLAARPEWPGTTHAIDLAAIGVFPYFTEGPTSPFFAYFVFSLVSATLRWGWRGTVLTGLVGIAVFVGLGIYASEVLRDPTFDPQRFVIRSVYMSVVTVLLASLGAFQDHRSTQIARLASWSRPAADQPSTMLNAVLAQASEILEVRRAILIWEEPEEPWLEVAVWERGHTTRHREAPGTFGDIVAPALAGTSFVCADAREPGASAVHWTPSGVRSWRGQPLDGRLRERFGIRAVAAWPLRDEAIAGWLLCLDKPALTVQDLVVGEVVADLAVGQLALSYLVARLKDSAVATERLRLARDLHDGVLQTLTGAALQLQTARRLVGSDPAAAEARLAQVQQTIAAEHSELRSFISQLNPTRGPVLGAGADLPARVEALADRIRRQWGVTVRIASGPRALLVPERLANDVYLLIHEALVNAARHAQATAIEVAVLQSNGRLSIAISDDGRGFPFKGTYDLEELVRRREGPRTLKERIGSLNGSLVIESRPSGSRLTLDLPLVEPAA